MGGSFDPVHWGHLVAAEQAREHFGLAQVLFVPCGVPPLPKDYPVSAPEHRFAMALLATADHPQFSVSRIEIERPGPSYTLDTLRTLRAEQRAGAEYFVITGADAVQELPRWRRPREVVELCTLVAVTRPGYELSELHRKLPSELAERVQVLPIPGFDLSSTEVRARVARGQTIRYLVADAVGAYIAKWGLYRKAGGKRPAAGQGESACQAEPVVSAEEARMRGG